MRYQHDGVPGHYARSVREYLNKVLPNKWIGRGGTTPWPAQSKNLTKLDFFLWDHVKQFIRKPTTIREVVMVQIFKTFCSVVY